MTEMTETRPISESLTYTHTYDFSNTDRYLSFLSLDKIRG